MRRCFLFCVHFSFGCNNRNKSGVTHTLSTSAEFKSFLLNMCINRFRKRTTNQHSTARIIQGKPRLTAKSTPPSASPNRVRWRNPQSNWVPPNHPLKSTRKKNNPFERTRHKPQLPYLQQRASYTHMRNHITFFSLHHKGWTQPLPPSDKRGYQGNRALTGDTFRDRHKSDIPTSCRNSTFLSHV